MGCASSSQKAGVIDAGSKYELDIAAGDGKKTILAGTPDSKADGHGAEQDELTRAPESAVDVAAGLKKQLEGTWYCGPSRYNLSMTANCRQCSLDEYLSGQKRTAILTKDGDDYWYQGELFSSGERIGILRLQFGDGKITTNFKAQEQDAWGQEIVGHRHEEQAIVFI